MSRRREHLHARALQIRAELSTHIHRETGSQRPTLSVGVCEGGGVRPPPRERVSRAVAEGRRAECVCEAESELESVKIGACFSLVQGGVDPTALPLFKVLLPSLLATIDPDDRRFRYEVCAIRTKIDR